MMASAQLPHIKPYILIREYSDDLVARTNQKYGLLHFHDPDTGISCWSTHGVSNVFTKWALAVKTDVDFQLSSPKHWVSQL